MMMETLIAILLLLNIALVVSLAGGSATVAILAFALVVAGIHSLMVKHSF